MTDKFSVVSSDGTTNTTVTITVTGVNDVPVLGGTATGGVTEDAVPNTATGTLTIADADAGQSSFTAQAGTAGTYGSFGLTTAGGWTYTLDNTKTAVQTLTADQTVTDKFTVVSVDGSAETTVTVTITGVNDVPVFVIGPDQTVLEDAGPNRGMQVAGSHVYWINNTSDNIQSSNLDGSDLTTVVVLPSGQDGMELEIDFEGGKLYWSDTDGNLVKRADGRLQRGNTRDQFGRVRRDPVGPGYRERQAVLRVA